MKLDMNQEIEHLTTVEAQVMFHQDQYPEIAPEMNLPHI